MHLSTALVAALIIVAVEQASAQMSKAYQAQCMAEMEPKFKAETDKDLAAKMAKGHEMFKNAVELVQGMNAEQKAKLVNTYFTGVISKQCQVELEAKHKAESDKNLSDTLTKIDDAYKGAIAIVQGMNAAQKDKLASKYFVGV
ncbi:hypothetical protein PRIPAC_82845 [Pristionchus pacificus]|uniref:Uncharacterized protein n=1 Tax=Pristionchus pacificus TaxID=54126 RepID=A0A2A6CJL6_PRIPA|nr:hypothetical protein PRIPAC_82845 [Pristionchus pacificus]|eukprot:PDM78296.1 hypothetical protein PRIPAC_30875 [Pristionchus pacificus]